jgi:uncharacterized protein
MIYTKCMSRELPFDPFPFLEDPHQQTIIGSFLNVLIEPTSECMLIALPDGDKLTAEVTTPPSWQETSPTILMVHGLCGSHQSPYLLRMTKRLEPLSMRVIRLNLRGCGSGRGLAKRMYHAGRSEDLFVAIKNIKEQTPYSPLMLIGFSLGGALTLKLVGELSSLATQFLVQAIAVNPPMDLYACVERIGRPENAFYENYFIRLLRDDVHYRHRKFKDLPRVHLPKNLKMYEFDQIYTAPYYGFRDAHDYYLKCSSAELISDIAIPCKILLSEDDPIIPSTMLDNTILPPQVELFKTKKGGHMGYVGNPNGDKGLHWLDYQLIEWIVPSKGCPSQSNGLDPSKDANLP